RAAAIHSAADPTTAGSGCCCPWPNGPAHRCADCCPVASRGAVLSADDPVPFSARPGCGVVHHSGDAATGSDVQPNGAAPRPGVAVQPDAVLPASAADRRHGGVAIHAGVPSRPGAPDRIAGRLPVCAVSTVPGCFVPVRVAAVLPDAFAHRLDGAGRPDSADFGGPVRPDAAAPTAVFVQFVAVPDAGVRPGPSGDADPGPDVRCYGVALRPGVVAGLLRCVDFRSDSAGSVPLSVLPVAGDGLHGYWKIGRAHV